MGDIVRIITFQTLTLYFQTLNLVLNHFHASDYIFVMTPWESLLQSNNGSSIIKQLALITFFILEYISIIYIYIYIYIHNKVKENAEMTLPKNHPKNKRINQHYEIVN